MINLTIELHKKQVLNINTYKSLHWAVKGKLTGNLVNIARRICDERESEKIFFEHFKVSVTVLPPTRRRLDPINLYPTVKALIDGFTINEENESGWWDDDDFKHLLEMSFKYGGLSGVKDHFILKIDIENISDTSDYVLDPDKK